MNTGYLTQGLIGWIDSQPNSESSESILEQMVAGLGTRLETSSATGTGFCCAATADCETDASGIAAVSIGSARLNDSQQAAQQDTESLIQRYFSLGIDLPHSISGEFSLLVIDPSANRCLAATDRLGRYPLYYAETESGIVVASTASSILAHPDIRKTISEQSLYDYVYFHMVPSPHTTYQGLSKLPAGCALVWEHGKLSVKKYWIPGFIRNSSKDTTALKSELKRLLKQSVADHLDQGRRTAAFLSGGLDSSTVAGFLSELQPDETEAFAIGFAADGYDEMPYARLTAKHFGIKLHEYYVTPEDVVEALPKIATSYDEPFGNSSALPAYFCAKMAHDEGVECLLAGDGGDELFAGNERYTKQAVFEDYFRIPRVLRSHALEPLLDILPSSPKLLSKAKSYVTQAKVPLPDRLQSYNYLHRHRPDELFTEKFLAKVDTQVPLQLQRDIYNLPKHASTLDRMLYLDWQFTLADNDLRKVSHMCALASVRVEYPMLDDQLLTFSTTIPDDLKIKGRRLRHFYKDALRGCLPDQTLSKSKHGFGLPFGVWMKEHKPLQEIACDSLSQLKTRSYFKPEFIDKTIEMHNSVHSAYYGELVWILTVLELWLSAHSNDA